jgi:hypothetical protein
MNENCPYCGEPQHFPVAYVDTVVTCRYCARQFLLSRHARDEYPATRLSPRDLRKVWEAILDWLRCLGWLIWW